ncbi:hypothetical protein [Microbacterium sp. NIBRBAC000506063]|uniref:hypothetical protein n=1 Tax=Microbacterium sp. NIBRBAC000506063 TaxID=2734618 RepID=UPI001BB4FA2F|nr:hypothetical protein [Microbacterium sp. NIBRBAC000506063]QTV79592.1 hypothetical protein KAE78_12210 [Microbacterium sp. NIBRBAC000506063]
MIDDTAPETTLVADGLLTMRIPEQPVLSPDGAVIAFVVREIDDDADEYRRRVHVRYVSESAYIAVTDGPTDSTPIWRADGDVGYLRQVAGRTHLLTLDVGASRTSRQLGVLPIGARARSGDQTAGESPMS